MLLNGNIDVPRHQNGIGDPRSAYVSQYAYVCWRISSLSSVMAQDK